jgi:hypothetical protein
VILRRVVLVFLEEMGFFEIVSRWTFEVFQEFCKYCDSRGKQPIFDQLKIFQPIVVGLFMVF